MQVSAPFEPASEPKRSPFAAVRALHAAEDLLINAVFLVMAVLPLLEIVLRKTIGTGVPSGSPIVQHLTLWAGFLGALLATRDDRHLALSTGDLLPAGKARTTATFFTRTLSGVVAALLAYASAKLVSADTGGDQKLVGSIPEWWSEVVMPGALILIAIRFAYRASAAWSGRIAAFVAISAAFIVPFFSDSLWPQGFPLSPGALLWPLAILILLALLAGAPIFIGMSGLAMLLFYTEGTPIASVPTETLRLVISPILPAIPLLTAAGFVLSEGGAARRLVRVSRAFVGWVPGGTAIMVCGVCAIFTAFTGGSGVTILALGGVVLPILIAEKYPEGFSLGLVTASGSLGLLFPPSFPVILYSVAAQIPDLNALFLAGLVPGVLMILLVCAYGVFAGIRNHTPRTPFRRDEALRALWQAKWELGLPLIVGWAIIGGWATIVESAALALVYAVVVEVLVFKDIPLKQLPHTITHGAALVGSVLILLGVALGLTSYFVDAGVPEIVVAWVKSHVETEVGFLMMLNVMLLVLGSVFEIYSAIVILAPLVAPLGVAYGVNPIHLAVVFLANLELGFLFPPMGLNLFLSSSRFHKPLPQLYRHAFPFLCIMAAGVLLVTYVPAMTLGVLELFGITPVIARP